jgi:hypothetical protein
LDGTLDDPFWLQATPISNFLQREPYEGQAPSERTEVRVLYDKHEVYFGITCFDSDPRVIVATELRMATVRSREEIASPPTILIVLREK